MHRWVVDLRQPEVVPVVDAAVMVSYLVSMAAVVGPTPLPHAYVLSFPSLSALRVSNGRLRVKCGDALQAQMYSSGKPCRSVLVYGAPSHLRRHLRTDAPNA